MRSYLKIKIGDTILFGTLGPTCARPQEKLTLRYHIYHKYHVHIQCLLNVRGWNMWIKYMWMVLKHDRSGVQALVSTTAALYWQAILLVEASLTLGRTQVWIPSSSEGFTQWSSLGLQQSLPHRHTQLRPPAHRLSLLSQKYIRFAWLFIVFQVGGHKGED